MDAADLQDAWNDGVELSFDLLAQPVTWNRQSVPAIVDSLPYSSMQRAGGGGFLEEFSGSLLFQKASFTGPPPCFPKVGDDVQIGRRLVRITEVANLDDMADPTLHCFYKPCST